MGSTTARIQSQTAGRRTGKSSAASFTEWAAAMVLPPRMVGMPTRHLPHRSQHPVHGVPLLLLLAIRISGRMRELTTRAVLSTLATLRCQGDCGADATPTSPELGPAS